MCVTYPARVVALGEGTSAEVDVAGRIQRISWIVLGDRVPRPGEWLLVHSGLAIAVIDEEEAAWRRRLVDEAREV